MFSADTDDSGVDEYDDDNCDDAHWARASPLELLRQSESNKQHSRATLHLADS